MVAVAAVVASAVVASATAVVVAGFGVVAAAVIARLRMDTPIIARLGMYAAIVAGLGVISPVVAGFGMRADVLCRLRLRLGAAVGGGHRGAGGTRQDNSGDGRNQWLSHWFLPHQSVGVHRERHTTRKNCAVNPIAATARMPMDVAVRTTDLPLAGEQLTVLYREHAGPLYGYARYLTETVADAEDLVQVTFMQAYGALERGQQLEHPRAWLMTTLRRRALNLARDRHDVASDELGTLASITDVSSSAAMNEQLAAVRTALERLPESQRHAFVLRHWSGLSASEIAEVMDTSEPSVQSLLSRARSALRADRQLKRAADAVTGMVFIPSTSVSDNLSELVPGFGRGQRGGRGRHGRGLGLHSRQDDPRAQGRIGGRGRYRRRRSGARTPPRLARTAGGRDRAVAPPRPRCR